MLYHTTFYLQHSRKLLSDFGDCLVKVSTSYVLKLCILATHAKNTVKTSTTSEKINSLPFSSRAHISASIYCSLSAAQTKVSLTLQSATYTVTQNININTSNLKLVTGNLFICRRRNTLTNSSALMYGIPSSVSSSSSSSSLG